MVVRVLHVVNGLGTGGAERSLAELLPGFARAGVESRVACLSRKHEGVHARVEERGVPVTVVGPGRARSLVGLRRLIRDWHPDIVHTSIFDADVLGRAAAVGTPARVLTSLVNTTYDGAAEADPSISARRLAAVRAVDRFTARHLTDHFHAISPAVRDSATAHLGIPADRVTVVPRGRDLGRLGAPSAARRRDVRDRLGLDSGAEVVLNVGRQEPQKGQDVLFRAVARLVEAHPDLVLVQAGRAGKSTAGLRTLVEELGLGERVRLLGHRDDVGDLLAAADVFAFPSVYEGLGGSVLEAMAMRVPVVVSDAPALVDVVAGGRAGVVVPVGDVEALAEALDRVLRTRALAGELADRALEEFTGRFTLERSVADMVTLFRDVLEGER